MYKCSRIFSEVDCGTTFPRILYSTSHLQDEDLTTYQAKLIVECDATYTTVLMTPYIYFECFEDGKWNNTIFSHRAHICMSKNM